MYDDPVITETYHQVSTAFGATTESQKFIGPRGKKGKVRDIEVFLTADAVGTTSVPEICVGVSQGSNEYARFRLGTTAILGYTAASTPRRASQVSKKDMRGDNNLADFVGHVQMNKLEIPADTVFFISRVQGVGGTPAGTGISRVTIDWT